MKAVILAGGLGSRLSEETHLRPKPMVEIGGKPILWHIMKLYSPRGDRRVHRLPGLQGLRHQGVVRQLRAPQLGRHVRPARGLDRPSTAPPPSRGRSRSSRPARRRRPAAGCERVLEYVGDDDFCFTYGDGRRGRRLARARRVPPRSGRARDRHRRAASGALRRDRGRRRSASRALVPGEAAGRRRLDQRRLLRLCAGGGRLHRRRRLRLGAGAARAAGARQPAGRLPPRRLLAADGHPARPQRHGAAMGVGAAPRGRRGRRSGLLAWPARPGHRAHRLQGRLADALAARSSAPRSPASPTPRPRRRRSTSWRASATAWTR